MRKMLTKSFILHGISCRFEVDMKKEVLKADWIFASISQHRILDKEPYRLIHSVS